MFVETGDLIANQEPITYYAHDCTMFNSLYEILIKRIYSFNIREKHRDQKLSIRN